MGYGRHATPLEQHATPPISAELQSEILNFLLWMKREGYSESSIRNIRKIVLKLARNLSTLLDGEAVKDYVARMEVRGSTKKNNLLAYMLYAKWKGFSFQLPRISDTEAAIPFIPLESELDALISAASKKLSSLLLLLKETGCRIGEALRLEWIDIDSDIRTVNIRAEKGSRNRQCRVSERLVAMILRLPKKDKFAFSGTKTGTLRNRLFTLRKRLSTKLENPRFMRIHFHTFRHWYATKTYHKTKDILFTQHALGHRSLHSTLRYTQLVNWENDDEFLCKAARTLTEITTIVEAGYDFVTRLEDGTQIFRKRK